MQAGIIVTYANIYIFKLLILSNKQVFNENFYIQTRSRACLKPISAPIWSSQSHEHFTRILDIS